MNSREDELAGFGLVLSLTCLTLCTTLAVQCSRSKQKKFKPIQPTTSPGARSPKSPGARSPKSPGARSPKTPTSKKEVSEKSVSAKSTSNSASEKSTSSDSAASEPLPKPEKPKAKPTAASKATADTPTPFGGVQRREPSAADSNIVSPNKKYEEFMKNLPKMKRVTRVRTPTPEMSPMVLTFVYYGDSWKRVEVYNDADFSFQLDTHS